MKKIIVIFHTDNWQSKSSYRFVGVASTKEKAIEMSRKDEYAIADVKDRDGIVLFVECKVNKLDSERELFNTSSQADRDYLLDF